MARPPALRLGDSECGQYHTIMIQARALWGHAGGPSRPGLIGILLSGAAVEHEFCVNDLGSRPDTGQGLSRWGR